MTGIPTNISAGYPPNRDGPPPALVPVSTGGLYPRDYRRRLDDDSAFAGVSEFDSTTVCHERASPIMGTAIHYHGAIREDIAPKLKPDRKTMYYEEDPATQEFLGSVLHTITPNQSRFEFDLNRPPDTTVYTKPSLAWGIDVWKTPLNQFEREFSLEKWYEFHTMIDCAVEDAINRFGYAILFDFHSYNYQRTGPTDWRTDGKPVINIGSRHLQLDAKGKEMMSWFMDEMRQHTVQGEEALIEENGVFYGGYLNRRLAHLYGSKAITLSVEYKKVYMDENTGEMYPEVLRDLITQMDTTIRDLGDHIGAATREKAALPFLSTAPPSPIPGE